MGESRYKELMAKRDGAGLTDDEANELGRMMAERSGKHYSHGAKPGDPPTRETEEWNEVRSQDDKSLNEDELRQELIDQEQTRGYEEGEAFPSM